MRIFLTVVSFLLIGTVNAVPTVIKGTAPEYANTSITFFKYQNQLSYKETSLGTCTVDSLGGFLLTLDLDKTTYVFSHLGIYNVYLFAEPGSEYQIILPEKADKEQADILNPYFQETYVHLSSENADDKELNVAIRMFNNTYMAYFGKYIIDNYQRKHYDELEKELEKLEKVYKNYKSEYFKNYRFYKYGLLNNSTLQQKSKESFLTYFEGKPVLYENNAYMDFFNQVFNEYFQYLGRTDKGKAIYDNINTEKSYEELKNTLQKQHAIDDENLMELVILKNIHDEFYKAKFSRAGLLAILAQLKEATTSELHKEIATAINDKLTRLLTGHLPPDFKLLDMEGDTISLSDLKGKYVYLNFCTSNSYACLSEYEMLKLLKEQHKEYLDIVTISSDETYESMKSFVKTRGYDWMFLHYGEQPDVLKDYDIRAFPTYFLLDKEGKLIMSPAPSPRENFEANLFKILRSRGDI